MPVHPKLTLPETNPKTTRAVKPPPRWRSEHVGKIRYSSYWGKYALVLHVDGYQVTELDAFAEINQHPSHARVRVHQTPPEKDDRFLTVAEFYAQVIGGK